MRVHISDIADHKEFLLCSGLSLWLEQMGMAVTAEETNFTLVRESTPLPRLLNETPAQATLPLPGPVRHRKAKEVSAREVEKALAGPVRRGRPPLKKVAPVETKPAVRETKAAARETNPVRRGGSDVVAETPAVSLRDAIRLAIGFGPCNSEVLTARVKDALPETSAKTLSTVIGQLKATRQIEQDERGIYDKGEKFPE